ncbi:MAG: hypothetical protein VW715_12505 [Rhodospirillales bacterium]
MNLEKYEGHTGPWKPHTIQPLYGNMVLFGFNEQDALLASEAPLLLAEVKRLRLLFRELINDMSADDYIEWCNRIGCPDGLEVELHKED